MALGIAKRARFGWLRGSPTTSHAELGYLADNLQQRLSRHQTVAQNTADVFRYGIGLDLQSLNLDAPSPLTAGTNRTEGRISNIYSLDILPRSRTS